MARCPRPQRVHRPADCHPNARPAPRLGHEPDGLCQRRHMGRPGVRSRRLVLALRISRLAHSVWPDLLWVDRPRRPQHSDSLPTRPHHRRARSGWAEPPPGTAWILLQHERGVPRHGAPLLRVQRRPGFDAGDSSRSRRHARTPESPAAAEPRATVRKRVEHLGQRFALVHPRAVHAVFSLYAAGLRVHGRTGRAAGPRSRAVPRARPGDPRGHEPRPLAEAPRRLRRVPRYARPGAAPRRA